MKNRIGIIDLGSNTFHLLIVEVEGLDFHFIYKKRSYVFLSQAGVKHIAKEAFERGIQTLAEFREIMDHYAVSECKAIGTAVLRSADNAEAFLQKAKSDYQIDIEVIHGQREAELILKGIQLACPLPSQQALMMDIGGGSVEFTLTNNNQVVYQESLPIGLGVLHNDYKLSDPAQYDEIVNIKHTLTRHSKKLIKYLKKYQPTTFIGAAGSFEVIADALMQDSSSNESNCALLHQIPLLQFIRPLIFSTYEERVENPFIPQKRVNLSVYAFIMVEWVLELNAYDAIYVSKYSLKEGLLSEMLLKV